MTLNIPVPWSFNENVAKTFRQHVRQSVPGYESTYSIFQALVKEFRKGPLRFVDLGAGIGESLYLMKPIFQSHDKALGLDRSEAMLEEARVRSYGVLKPVFKQGDILLYKIPKHDVCLLTYTLSFVPPERRVKLLRRILDASKKGILLFSDKILNEDPIVSDVMQARLDNFKISRGISKSDVALKKNSLEGVMKPWTLHQYCSSMTQAGWLSPHLLSLDTSFFSCVLFHPELRH